MGASALFIATVLLLHGALADNVTTSFILPDGLFFPSAVLLSFVGQSSISSGTTSYTVLCPEALWGFEPGSGCQGYSGYSSYTFSEYQSTTQYVMPDYIFGQIPHEATDAVPFYLSTFLQTITINCGRTVTSSKVKCTYTTLFNDEPLAVTGDTSIISSTILTRSRAYNQTSSYPVVLTDARAAATVAATPSTSPASSTSNPTKLISTTPLSNSTTTAFLTTTSTTQPELTSISKPLSSHAISPGSEAGIIIGVFIAVFAFACLLFVLIFRKRTHSRLNTRDAGFVPPHSSADQEVERKDNGRQNVVADVSGLHEMDGKRTPDISGLHEVEGIPAPENKGVYEIQGN